MSKCACYPIIDQGTPAEIVSRYPHRLFAVRGGNMFRILKELRTHEGISRCSSFGCECHVAVADNGPDASSLLAILEKAGIQGCSVEEIQAGIEDCFIGLS